MIKDSSTFRSYIHAHTHAPTHTHGQGERKGEEERRHAGGCLKYTNHKSLLQNTLRTPVDQEEEKNKERSR